MGGFFKKDKSVQCFKEQKYVKIRKQCLKLGNNTVYKDLKFPASDSILTVGDDIPRNIEWKRPKEIHDCPSLLVGFLGQSAVRPGALSQQWVTSAFALLAVRTELWHWVVPQYRAQCWKEEPAKHPGIFHFRLWYRGSWTDVVIDDLLPTLDGRPSGAHSTCPSEWWPALLEKAYAKLLGSYAALKSVSLGDVLVDLTGGVSELWPLLHTTESSSEENIWPLFHRLTTELLQQSFVTAWILPPASQQDQNTPERSSLGLELGQAYVVLAARKVQLEGSLLKGLFKGKEKIALVHLFSPCHELSVDASNGPGKSGDSATSRSSYVFSHKHLSRMLTKVPEWSRLSDTDKEKLGLAVDDEREFWMPAEDFMNQFTQLCVCRLLSYAGPPALTCSSGDHHRWNETSALGSWPLSTRDALPSSPTHPESLLRNPQFLLEVRNEKGGEVVLQLLQWSMDKKPLESRTFPPIGFRVLKVEENRLYRLHTLLSHCPSVQSVGPVSSRSLNHQVHLARGRYVILPFTEERSAQFQSHFVLRCFSTASINLSESKLDSPPSPWWSCMKAKSECVTVVTVKGAEGLKHSSSIFACNPYCEIRCEGVQVHTQVVYKNTEPTWDASFVFYRSSLDTPLVVNVRSHRTLLPSLLIGQAQVPAPVNHQPSLLRAELRLPGQEDGAPQGVLVLEVTTEDDLNAI